MLGYDTLTMYAVHKPAVVAEVINGELVAIQLETGCYYHANQSGSCIWSLLEAGYDSAGIPQALVTAYAISEETAKKHSDQFIATLLREKLIKVSPTEEKQNATQPDISLSPDSKYSMPALKKHEDMKELLLLDPIHDIGENPWPLEKVAA